MALTYLIILFSFITANFIWGEILEYLNRLNRPAKVPEKLKGFYDQEKYALSLAYKKDHDQVGSLSSWIGYLLMAGFLLLRGFGWLNEFIEGFGLTGHWLSLAYFGVLFIISDLIGLPFALYSTFVIEERYGFNKTDLRTFFIDKLKSYVMTLFLGGGLLYVFLWIIDYMGTNFWWYAWILMTAVMLFMNFFYTTLLLPIFNKLTPLQDGELKEAIEGLSQKLDFPLKNIMVMDASKRSTKSNAFFSGFGKLKSIVLYDTLIAQHSQDELLAILAHEVGHYKKKHIISNLVSGVIVNGFMLFILSKFIFSEDIPLALGAEPSYEPYYHLNLIAFAILFEPISLLTGLLGSVISRRHEYEADEYAVLNTSKEAMINALKKLSNENLSDLMPHPAYVFFHYSHPTLLQRISAIEQIDDAKDSVVS